MNATLVVLISAAVLVSLIHWIAAFVVARRDPRQSVLSAFLVGWNTAKFPLMSPRAWSFVVTLTAAFLAAAVAMCESRPG